MRKAVRILGTRGLPANHSGFETFAGNLAPDLAARGWDVTVYCQEPSDGRRGEESWRGVRLIHLNTRIASASAASMLFDWRATLDAASAGELALVLGYNTALFSAIFRLRGVPSIMNMDGLDVLRPKWRFPVRQFFQANERLGPLLSNHLVADHPAIADYLGRRGARPHDVTVIPYGAESVQTADPIVLRDLGLEPQGYALVVCRPEAGHSLGKIVRAFSRRKRDAKLVVLGRYEPMRDGFHNKIRRAAGEDVLFPGAIFDKPVVQALRFHARLYLHGHCFGGTNPSLVESLAAGTPVLARDNVFNRWVAGPGARYFRDESDCAEALDFLLEDATELSRMSQESRRRHAEAFTWERCLGAYERLLAGWLPC